MKKIRIKKALAAGLASIMLLVSCFGTATVYAASADGEADEKVTAEAAEETVSEKEAPVEEKTDAAEPAGPEVTVETVNPEVEPEVKAPEVSAEGTETEKTEEAPEETQKAAPRLGSAPSGQEEGKEWLLPENFENQTVDGSAVYPLYEKYSLTHGMKVEEKGAAASDGKVFKKRFNAGSPNKDAAGNMKVTSEKSVRIEIEKLSHIIVYAQSSGSARILQMADADGRAVKDFVAVGKSDPLTPSAAFTLQPGTYYLYSPNSTVYTYGIHIQDGPAPRRAWSEVPAPVITDVKREESGALMVSFEGEFGTDGADKGRVFMFKNGFEAGCTEVTGANPVTFKPDANGDYSFKVILLREGEADRESDVFEVKGYVMPPRSLPLPG